ncbi:MAG: hypothetical protein B6I36_08150 [Desulfobacteraceae bacterium 4572_35.1]|nr:MAG: hypothetical protein B6I36_08150 [Desulfobacteraceae bacterium 4572_35.1]
MFKMLKNERGFVLITSLLMLTVLMIIGIAATNTTTIELQISGNDKAAKQNFYASESAAYEGGIVLKKIKSELESGTPPTFVQQLKIDLPNYSADEKSAKRTEFLEAATNSSGDDVAIRNPATWVQEGNAGENSSDGVISNTSFRAADLGPSGTSSVTANGKTTVRRKCAVVGLYSDTVAGARRGTSMIELGLRF